MQPALNSGLPEAHYLKGLSYIQEAEKTWQGRPGFGFGSNQNHETQKKELLTKAKDHLLQAARKGHEDAEKVFRPLIIGANNKQVKQLFWSLFAFLLLSVPPNGKAAARKLPLSTFCLYDFSE